MRDELTQGVEDLMSNSVSTRRRRQIQRRISTAQLTFDFYSFAAFVALIDVDRRLVGLSVFAGGDEDDEDEDEDEDIHSTSTNGIDDDGVLDEKLLVHAVKRSRMVVSTFSTTTNIDRGFKALKEYVAGKSIKAVARYYDTSK